MSNTDIYYFIQTIHGMMKLMGLAHRVLPSEIYTMRDMTPMASHSLIQDRQYRMR